MDNLLDTNVISQRTKPEPHRGVMSWLSATPSSETYLSVVSFTEIRFGIQQMDTGRKRQSLEYWLEQDVRAGFAGRVLRIDERIADEAGRLNSIARNSGNTPELADLLIAATARVHGLRLATLNREHFERLGVELVEF